MVRLGGGLFEAGKDTMPLAARMRPVSLDEIVGQDHLLGKSRPLRRAIETDRLGSLVLYGPPGSGKTTIAEVIAGTTSSKFVRLNAVYSGVADIRRVIAGARDALSMNGERTVVFIDEIHRFNKSQQDALLPAVEDGSITLIGATTENPFFDIVAPLVSRSRIFMLKPISSEELGKLLRRAATDPERGLGGSGLSFEEAALDYIARHAGGDARIALNVLEMAAIATEDGNVGMKLVSDILGRTLLKYDMQGDIHYDVISAFIKSMRGSDPDAALHYLARMLDSGEDPRFVARRILIHASEDVGMADPSAVMVAAAAAYAVEHIGMPEARITLAQAAIHIATAPKSNAVVEGINAALQDLKDKPLGQVPQHLASGGYKGAEKLGKGIGYEYPHSFPGGWIEQQYMPDEFAGAKYYKPPETGGYEPVRIRVSLKAFLADGVIYIKRQGDGKAELPWTYARTGEPAREAAMRIAQKAGLVLAGELSPQDIGEVFRAGRTRDMHVLFQVGASFGPGGVPEGFMVVKEGA